MSPTNSSTTTINMKRPLIIWIAQAMLILLGLLLFSAFLLNVVVLLTHRENQVSILPILIVYAVWLGIVNVAASTSLIIL